MRGSSRAIQNHYTKRSSYGKVVEYLYCTEKNSAVCVVSSPQITDGYQCFSSNECQAEKLNRVYQSSIKCTAERRIIV